MEIKQSEDATISTKQFKEESGVGRVSKSLCNAQVHHNDCSNYLVSCNTDLDRLLNLEPVVKTLGN